MKNILIIKLRYLGDVLLATPVIGQLRHAFPQAKLTMLINRGTEDVVRRNQSLDEVLVLERGGLASQAGFCLDLWRRGFDCVIDLTDGDRAAFLSWITRAPVRIGFNQEGRWRGIAYTTVASEPGNVHRIERDLSCLRELGLVPDRGLPVLSPAPEDEEAGHRILGESGVQVGRAPLVMLQPGARYWFKAWPVDRFVELANRLSRSTGCQLLVGGGSDEKPLAEAIVSQARGRVVELAGRTTVLQYAAILKQCALFVGNDSGAMHMAAAVGTPVIGLFGPSDPKAWGPRGKRVTAIYKGLDCRACFHPTCTRGELNCMKQISVDEVYGAALRVLQEDRTGAGWA